MSAFSQLVFYLLTAAFVQNLVLSAGFGSSTLLRITRRPRDILLFSGMLCGFSLLTVLIAYPLDLLIGTSWDAKLIRPVLLIVIAALLYIGAALILKKRFPPAYQRVRRTLPLATFNNVVIGVALIVNHQFSVSLAGAVGLSLGSCLGFLVLSLLTAEARDRMDNPDVPQAFRGLPIALVYLGLMALALLGFKTGVSFI